MKTLIYTSIYSNLWGTDFGGRPGRSLHYKYSLLSILNLNSHKFICFTSESELPDLENWFYEINNISKDVLEFIVFDLTKTKYYDKIFKLKDSQVMTISDRCYEIQYNKFFWLENIPNLNDYDKVYWFDSGLSHGGILPEKYSYGSGYEKHFTFTVFNPDYLNYLNNISDDKIVLLSKNNSGKFYWSTTIPPKYYSKYNNHEHIVGGFFGGNTTSMLKLKDDFESLLIELLNNEPELYYEELIMSCLYKNDLNNYISLKFDDWYDRQLPEIYDENTKYFYRVFDIKPNIKTCVCGVAIEINGGSRYLESAMKMVKTNLEYTNYDILLLTNNVEFFNEINCERLILIDYSKNFNEPILSDNRFNMHIKRQPIKLASNLNYDVIYYNDCDCFINGWDDYSFKEKCYEDFDVAFVSHANPQLGGLRKAYPHFQEKIDLEFDGLYYDELDDSPNPAETRVIFKNNEKLTKFLHFWDLISKQNNNYFTYHDGVYFGTSSIYAKMKMIGVTPYDPFTKYCRISHGEGELDYFGVNVSIGVTDNKINIDDNVVTNDENYVPGSINYNGLPMLQHKNIIDKFKQLIKLNKPTRIVEIGTEYGGLTLLLQDIVNELNLETKIRTYDIKDPVFLIDHPELTSTIEIVNKDLFEYHPFKLKDESLIELNDFLTEDGVNIILCDGASKKDEFNSFSKIIKSGDIIMLHDYIDNDEEFETNFLNKIWNWHESKYSDIETSVKEQGLSPYLEVDFSSVVWGCFIKK
jgi:hypothetical protein